MTSLNIRMPAFRTYTFANFDLFRGPFYPVVFHMLAFGYQVRSRTTEGRYSGARKHLTEYGSALNNSDMVSYDDSPFSSRTESKVSY